MSGLPENFFEDLHSLAQQAHEFLERVYISGDGNAMPTIEQNAVDRDKVITEAAATISDSLDGVATGLHAIADAIRETRTK